MSEMIKGAIVPVVVAVISSGAFTAFAQWFFRRNDDVQTLNKRCDSVIRNCNDQAEALSVLVEALSIMLEAMHAKGLINGESEHVRQSINNYLLLCTKTSLHMTLYDK